MPGMSADVEVSHPDGTRFVLRDANLPWAHDVYPASEGWAVRVLPGEVPVLDAAVVFTGSTVVYDEAAGVTA